MNKIDNKSYNCPIEATLDVVGGKWKVIILWYLYEKTMRFSELKKVLPGITQKMLTQQLRELERDGMINRKIYAQVPPKVEYSLTEYGKSIKPILQAMLEWGKKHINKNKNNCEIRK
ncbi:MAG: hypothetical protein PWP31_1116 [Clostridia bacterium]|nr:hypothetical protein [Clostridia bacterium]